MSGGLITTRAASESQLGEEVATQLFAKSRPLAVAAGALLAARAHPRPAEVLVHHRRRAARAAPPGESQGRGGGAGGGRRAAPRRSRTHGRSPPSIRSASRSATRWSRWSTRSRAARCWRACARSAGRSRPRPAWSCRRCTSPTTCSSGRAATRFSSRASKWPAASCCRSPARDQSRHRATPLDGTRRASRRSGCRRCGSRPNSAIARRRPATPSSIRPPRSRRTCPKRSAAFLPDLLTRQQTKELIDRVAQTSPKLVEELVPKLVSIGDIQRVLRQLLRERVPIRDLATILEAIADAAASTKDPGRAHRSRARGDRPSHLPAVPDREGRAARPSRWRPRSRSGWWSRSSGPSREPCSRSTRRRRRTWPRGSPARRAGRGTACASVFAGAEAAPVAAVRPRVAAHRGAVARRDARTTFAVAPVAMLD